MPSKKERAKQREKRREKRLGNNSKQAQPDEISDNVLSAHATIAALMERSEADATVSGLV